MKHVARFTVFALSVCTAVAQSKTPAPTTGYKGKALALYAPRPDYPKDATGRRPTGTGVVLVDVDPKTGWVRSARMEKSTGSKLLDDAAIAAFSRWRFRPGTVRQVHSPITFTHR